MDKKINWRSRSGEKMEKRGKKSKNKENKNRNTSKK